VNENSDTFVMDVLDPSKKVWARARRKAKDLSWTQLMDWCVGERGDARAFIRCRVPTDATDAHTSGELHDAGHTKEDMRAALIKIPVLQGALVAVELAKKNGAELRCLSDANEYYIGWILEALGVRATRLGAPTSRCPHFITPPPSDSTPSARQCCRPLRRLPLSAALVALAAALAGTRRTRLASRPSPYHTNRARASSRHCRTDAGIADSFTIVVTNGASTDDSGRVRIRPYQPLDVPHGCRFCPANLCKVPLRACQPLAWKPCHSPHALHLHAFVVVPQGGVMDRWIAEFGDARPRCIYVGDGEGACSRAPCREVAASRRPVRAPPQPFRRGSSVWQATSALPCGSPPRTCSVRGCHRTTGCSGRLPIRPKEPRRCEQIAWPGAPMPPPSARAACLLDSCLLACSTLIVTTGRVADYPQMSAQIHEWSEANDGASLAAGFSAAFASR
jgi:hypothetical protein